MKHEFEDLKIRWENFISRFETLSPDIYGHKTNVFYEMVSSERTKQSFVEMARGTRPFVAKEIWNLLEKFMDFMKNLPDPEGHNYRAVYQRMTSAGLIKRLLTKRPLVFLNQEDTHVLRTDPLKTQTKRKGWTQVAKTLKKPNDDLPYLREYISYDEILLAALVNMATPTYFVSDGSLRDPTEKPSRPFIQQGILCGLVGARLEKEGFMEHRFVLPRDETLSNFEGVHLADKFWIDNVFKDAFPEGKIPTEQEITDKPDLYSGIYVDGVNVAYFKKRLMLSVVPFIEEAISRGVENKTPVVVSVPGIGAGVWRGPLNSKTIVDLIVTGVLEYLDNEFDTDNLSYISAVFLPKTLTNVYSSFQRKNQIASIKPNTTDSTIEVSFEGPDKREITIINSSRFVAQPLPEKFKSCLVVAGYAWDGNSFPGNEYWIDSFGSFDPQAILCSLLGQFQNPIVNTKLADAERIKIY